MTKRDLTELYIKLKYGLRIKKPLFLLRVLKGYIEIKLFGKVPLEYVDFAFDYRCNLKCQHCFARSFSLSKDKKKMNIEDYKRVAEEAMKLGVVVFNFQGGEPFLPELSSYLEEIIKAVKPNRNLINITTNGTLLDERKIKRIKELGVDKLVFSLDSGIAEEHDKFRGVRNTFNRATKNIDLALKNGLRVAINTTLTHQSLYSDGFKKLIEFAEKRNIFVNTIFPAPVGAWEGNMKIVLTKTDTAYINKLRKEHPLLRRDVDSTFVKWGCLAVKEAVYITAYGDVLACPFIHISLGNIFQDSLDKIRKRGLKIKFFDHYDKKCFASENYEFMKKYLSYTKGKELPMDYSQVKEWWCS